MQLGIVVPCYNEEDILHNTTICLLEILSRLKNAGKLSANSSVYFIDDGSSDSTWQIIESLAQLHPEIHGIKLSRNQGHQNALMAGLHYAEGDALISVDADLQDDINVIETMVDHFLKGSAVVYGVRDDRTTDTFYKRWTAEGYYKALRLMGVNIIFNHADYRLLGRCAVDALLNFEERNLFLRGIIPLLGFPSSTVAYSRKARLAGESKYNLKRMLSLALDGVTSFSTFPLRVITGIGLSVFVLSMIFGLYALWIRLFTDLAVPGWASTVIPFYFLGGIQLLCIGVIGEYMAKIYTEVKRRPRFIVEKLV